MNTINTIILPHCIKHKYTNYMYLAIFIISLVAINAIGLNAQGANEFVENELIVKFKTSNINQLNFQPEQIQLGILKIDSLNKYYNATDINITGSRRTSDAFLIRFGEKHDINLLIESYLSTGLLEWAEPNYIGYGGGQEDLIQSIPDDEHFNRQYGLYNDGSFQFLPAKADADIDMELAWEIEQGDPNIIVAVLDAGSRMGHPEFAGRHWNNTGESETGTDSDNNGYVDDINGWDFVNNDNDPTDDHGHGTNVAGIAVANGNNGIGYAGVDWNCKLMTCKILNQNNSGQYTKWAEAIYYAVDNGAKVLNMSVGGSGFSQLMSEAVDYAYNNSVIIVACMMNTNNNITYYPAGYQSTIAVGATNPDDTRADPFTWSSRSGSNFGNHIDVVAPGNYIYGLSNNSDTNYESYWGGTSQATPLVTGLCALLLAQDPTRSPDEIRQIIRSTAEDQTGDPAEDKPGFDNYYGYGRINAHEALKQTGTGVYNQSDNNPNISVYPNPAADYVYVQIKIMNKAIKIINSLGKIVYEKALTGEEDLMKINTSAYPEGAYMIIIESNDFNNTFSGKFIVN